MCGGVWLVHCLFQLIAEVLMVLELKTSWQKQCLVFITLVCLTHFFLSFFPSFHPNTFSKVPNYGNNAWSASVKGRPVCSRHRKYYIKIYKLIQSMTYLRPNCTLSLIFRDFVAFASHINRCCIIKTCQIRLADDLCGVQHCWAEHGRSEEQFLL